MSDSDGRSTQGTAVAAEIAAVEGDWERLEAAATQLLSDARKGKQGEIDTEVER